MSRGTRYVWAGTRAPQLRGRKTGSSVRGSPRSKPRSRAEQDTPRSAPGAEGNPLHLFSVPRPPGGGRELVFLPSPCQRCGIEDAGVVGHRRSLARTDPPFPSPTFSLSRTWHPRIFPLREKVRVPNSTKGGHSVTLLPPSSPLTPAACPRYTPRMLSSSPGTRTQLRQPAATKELKSRVDPPAPAGKCSSSGRRPRPSGWNPRAGVVRVWERL